MLAYYDEDSSCWQEEDDSNEIRDERTQDGEKEFLLCSKTDHFTTFAVLLGDDGKPQHHAQPLLVKTTT